MGGLDSGITVFWSVQKRGKGKTKSSHYDAGLQTLSSSNAWQHQGWGKKLMSEAERISREEHGCREILVRSALGTKSYYFSLGYHRDAAYVSKLL